MKYNLNSSEVARTGEGGNLFCSVIFHTLLGVFQEKVPFCWWAVETGKLKWELYTNGMSPLLENNIRPFCAKVDEFYGFSFTNKSVTLHKA